MLQHKPWIGERYNSGFHGKKLLIVGHSHHGSEDHDDFTIHAVEKLALTGDHWFFNAIAGYFGAVSGKDFWEQVAFINTLPNLVGEADRRYEAGTAEQRRAVPGRVLRVIYDLKPQKAIVFSKAAWKVWPTFDGSVEEGALLVPETDDIWYGSYANKTDQPTLAYQLRHPQYASKDAMMRSVDAIMQHQLA